MNRLLTGDTWRELAVVANASTAKRAAIAYVTTELIEFGAGDTLIVDASDSAIANGNTDAVTLENALNRGASLYSLAHLHAKILVMDSATSIGSANMSESSQTRLVEANWLSDEESLNSSANEFIDSLLPMAQTVDAGFIERIKQIEVRRSGSNRYRRQRSHPTLLYFQEVLPGDIEKYRTTSASSGTGGGARDLRISPQEIYLPVVQRMFPNPAEEGATSGTIVWEQNGVDHRKIMNLHLPTESRSNELRIGRFYDIGGWEIDRDQYLAERDAGLIWFYVLEMGSSGLVSARLLQMQHLDLEDPLVVEHINRQHAEARVDHATRGAVDLQNRTCVPAQA